MNHVVLFKNAIANLIRGSASALVAILLPPFLTRMLPNDSYGAWVLVLQLSAYVGYLDFGIQTAVGRFVAHANELNDSHQRNRIVSTALAILGIAGAVGVLVILGLAWQLPLLFPKMPTQLYGNTRWALILVGSSLAIGLPFSVFNSIFIGLQRHEIPAFIIGASKLIGALLIIFFAHLTGNIAVMGVALAAINLTSYLIQFAAARKVVKEIRLTPEFITRQATRELINYCFSLTVWSFGILLVSGLDITIVGFFDYASVATYAIASSLINFIQGIQAAIFLVLLPAAAVLGARSDSRALAQMLISSTRYGVYILLLVGLPLILGAKPFLRVWVGEEYAASGAIILQVLTIANIVRLIGMPYANMIIGVGQQRLIILSPLVEGVANLAVSLLLAAHYGAIGAAVGTLFGSFISIGFHIWYNIPRTTDIATSQRSYLFDGILYPLLCGVPAVVMEILLINFTDLPYLYSLALGGVAFVITLSTVWYFGLLTSERQTILSIFNRLWAPSPK